MISVQLSTCADDRRVLNKTINNVITTNCSVKGSITITNPVIYVKYNSEIMGCNYAYIPAYNRYYFIDNVELEPGDIMQITLSVDVLMSYNEQIKNVTAIAIRGNNRSRYLQDYADMQAATTTVDIINSDSAVMPPLTTHNYPYILQVMGGVGV